MLSVMAVRPRMILAVWPGIWWSPGWPSQQRRGGAERAEPTLDAFGLALGSRNPLRALTVPLDGAGRDPGLKRGQVG